VSRDNVENTHTIRARERVAVGAAGGEDRVRAQSVRTKVRGSGPTANAVRQASLTASAVESANAEEANASLFC